MKTPTTIKTASALFASTILLSLSGHAQKTAPSATQATTLSMINVEGEYNTPNYTRSDWGLSAKFTAYDRATLPTTRSPLSYAVTANGIIKGKAMGAPFTAAEGNGLVVLKSDGATFSGSLKVFTRTIWSVNDKSLAEFNAVGPSGVRPNSGEFVLETSTSATIPFTVGPIPINVTATVKASISTRYVATVTNARTNAGTRINLVCGPEASAAATAEVSVGAGIEGVASVRVGASGTLRIGSAGVVGNLSLIPVLRQQGNTGMDLNGSVVLNKRGRSGQIDVFAEADIIFVGKHRVSKTIAEFTTSPQTTTLATINRPIF